MKHEACYAVTTELTHGNLTVHFLLCILDNGREGRRRDGSPEIWSAAVRASFLELSSAYFRKHGYRHPKSATYWIDFGKGGLAVKIKASSMKLHPGRAKQYRVMLRLYVDKVWRIRNQSSCSPAPSLSRGLKLQLFLNENHELKAKKELFRVYIPLTPVRWVPVLSSSYLSLDLSPEVRQHVSARLSDYPIVEAPIAPFQAVKVLAPQEGNPFIASFSGEDSVATYMFPDKVKGYEVIRVNEEVENVYPSIAMQPIIAINNFLGEMYNLIVVTSFDSSAEAPSFQNAGEPNFVAPNLIVDDPIYPLTTPVEPILTPLPETFTASTDGRTTADAAAPPTEDSGSRCSPPSTDEELGRCDEYSSTEIKTDVVPLPTEESEILDSPSATDRRTPVECCTVNNAAVTPTPILQSRLVGQLLRHCRHTNANEDSATIQPLRLPLRPLNQPPGTVVLLRQRTVEALTSIDLLILQPSLLYRTSSNLRTLAVPQLIEDYGIFISMTPTDEYQTMHPSTVAVQPILQITTCNALPSARKRKTLDSPQLTCVEGRGFKKRRTVDVATVVALPCTLKSTTAVVSSHSTNPDTVYGLTPSVERRTLAWSPQTCVDTRGFNELRSNDRVTVVALSYTFESATAVASSHGIEPATINSLTPHMEGRTLASPLTIDVDRLEFSECRTGDLATVVASPLTLEPATAVDSQHNVEHATVDPLPPAMELGVLASTPPTGVERRGFDVCQPAYPATVASPPPTDKACTIAFPLLAEYRIDSQLAFKAPRLNTGPFTVAFEPSASDRLFSLFAEDKKRGNPRRLHVSQDYAAILFRNFKPFSHWKKSSYFLRILSIAITCCAIFISIDFIPIV